MNKPGHNRLLVVGGSGFIGQHVVKKSLEKGFKTTVLSKNNSTNDLNGVKHLIANISNKENLLISLKDRVFDYVINLGGYIDHVNYSNGGSEVYDVHFTGVRNLIDCLDRSHLKGFVQVGSSDEYGNNPAPQSENQREAPISTYSSAKVASTYFLQTLYKTEKLPVVILRPFLVYGPGQGDDRFIPQIIKGCLNNQKFPTSKGEQLRDFCFIDDFIRAIFSALDNEKAHGEVVNIASGKPISVKKIINKIVNIIGSGEPMYGEVAYRSGENMRLFGDITKAKDLLNWKPYTSLEYGLEKTINWTKESNNE